VATPRAIRIPRPPLTPTDAGAPSPPSPGRESPTGRSREAGELRRNQAATERASRLAAIYLGALIVLYVGFVLLDRTSPGGTSASAEMGVLYFTAIAAAMGAVGALVALSPAPRSIEIRSDSVIVTEWWGRRRRFPPLEELRVSVVRRFPRSFLSSRAVETVELGTLAGGRRTYQLEEGLIPLPRAESGPRDR
jgi:hypothetical protein